MIAMIAIIALAIFIPGCARACMEHLRDEQGTPFRRSIWHSHESLWRVDDSADHETGMRLSHTGVVLGSQLHRQELRVYYKIGQIDPKSILLGVKLEDSIESGREPFYCQPVQFTSQFLSYSDCPPTGSRLGHGVFNYSISVTATVVYNNDSNSSGRLSTSLLSIHQSLIIINRPKVPWPLENEPGIWPPQEPNAVANIMEDYQTFNGVGAPYWHQGLDIRSELSESSTFNFQQPLTDGYQSKQLAGKVHSTTAGRVVNRVRYGGGDLYWSVMVLDSYGFVWQYHHMDPRTISVNIGDMVTEGQVLGQIAYWPSRQNGHNYHHVHMNVVRPHPSWFTSTGGGELNAPKPYTDGWSYYNPYDFLDHGARYWNDIPPTTDGMIYFIRHGEADAFAAVDTTATTPVIPTINGTVHIVMSFQSQFRPSNRVPGYPYVLGVNELWWKVKAVDHFANRPADDGDLDTVKSAVWNSSFGQIPPTYLLSMARMGADWPCAPQFTVACSDRFLLSIHRRRFTFRSRRMESIFNYNNRRLFYSVTNTGAFGYPVGEWHEDAGWQTAQRLFGKPRFPNGVYRLTIGARDWWRNKAEVSLLVNVEN